MAPADDDGLDKSPWYVRAFVRVGMPTAFAAILLWFLMTNITGNLLHVQMSQDELLRVTAQVISNQERIIALLNDHAVDQRATAGVLLALCYNNATLPEQRVRCNDALRVR